jgi:hypothetical protein
MDSLTCGCDCVNNVLILNRFSLPGTFDRVPEEQLNERLMNVGKLVSSLRWRDFHQQVFALG